MDCSGQIGLSAVYRAQRFVRFFEQALHIGVWCGKVSTFGVKRNESGRMSVPYIAVKPIIPLQWMYRNKQPAYIRRLAGRFWIRSGEYEQQDR